MSRSVLVLDESKNARLYESTNLFKRITGKKQLSCSSVFMNEEIDNRLMKQKVLLVFEGEEFYIRILTLPRVKKQLMDNLVVNELTYIFKEIYNFKFTYEVLSKNKREIKVLVFCINSEKNNIFNILSEKCSISGIYLIQLCIFRHIKDSLMKNKNIIIFQYNNYVYIMASCNGNIMANVVLRMSNEKNDELIQKVQYVANRATELEKESQVIDENYEIVFVNFDDKDIIADLNDIYNCHDLGELQIDDIIERLR